MRALQRLREGGGCKEDGRSLGGASEWRQGSDDAKGERKRKKKTGQSEKDEGIEGRVGKRKHAIDVVDDCIGSFLPSLAL
jgi:hypothetical protein